MEGLFFFFFFSSRRRHTRLQGDWSSDVCSSDLVHRGDRRRHGQGSRLVRQRVGLLEPGEGLDQVHGQKLVALATLGVDHLDLGGKRVFLRVDLNVPIEDGRVGEDTRIRSVLPTIERCLEGGASVILASHLGRPKGKPDPRYSLKPVAARLEELLNRPVPLLPDCVGPEVTAAAAALKPGDVVLLENLRFHAEEEVNDPEFARALASLADVYVDDAFAAAHRAHASIQGITRYLKPAVAGLLMQRELEALGRIF